MSAARGGGGKASSVKIVLVGPSNAGKTSIAKRFTTDQFDDFQDMTVGSAFFSKQLQSTRHSTSVRVEVWDTAGQEKYRAMAPMYFRNAAGALLVYSQAAPESFDDIERVWLPELLPHMKNSTQFVVLCGNKADLVSSSDSAVAALQARVDAMCSARGIRFYATSAKTGQNIADVFAALVDDILEARARDAASAKAERSSVAAQPVAVGSGASGGGGGSSGDGGSSSGKCCK